MHIYLKLIIAFIHWLIFTHLIKFHPKFFYNSLNSLWRYSYTVYSVRLTFLKALCQSLWLQSMRLLSKPCVRQSSWNFPQHQCLPLRVVLQFPVFPAFYSWFTSSFCERIPSNSALRKSTYMGGIILDLICLKIPSFTLTLDW